MIKKRYLIALNTILAKEITRFLRIWSQTFLPPVITMALYFVVFGRFVGSRVGEIEGFSYIQFIAPGLVMMSAITNAYANVCSSFFSAKFMRNIEEMLVAPIPNVYILLGYILSGALRGVIIGILVMFVALLFTHIPVHNILIMLIALVFSTLLFATIGLINGIFARKFDDVNIVPTFILTPLTYLGGVFYSIHLLSPLWYKVSLINPLVYIINSFRYGVLGISDVPVLTSLMAIILFGVLLFLIALYLLNKGIGVKN